MTPFEFVGWTFAVGFAVFVFGLLAVIGMTAYKDVIEDWPRSKD